MADTTIVDVESGTQTRGKKVVDAYESRLGEVKTGLNAYEAQKADEGKTDEQKAAEREEKVREACSVIQTLEELLSNQNGAEAEKQAISEMKKAKDMGVIEQGPQHTMLFPVKAEVPAYATVNMPLSIQKNFRKKIFGLLIAQMAVTWLIMAILHFTPPLAALCNFENWVGAGWFLFICAMALVALSHFKYRYPLNYAILSVFTVMQSFFFEACAQYFKTNGMMYIWTLLFIGMICLGAAAQLPSMKKVKEGQEKPLINMVLAGVVALCVMVPLSVIQHFAFPVYETRAAWIASICIASFLILWSSLEAQVMTRRMTPDDYMQAIVFFYTDTFLVLATINVVVCIVMKGECANGGGCGDMDCGADFDSGAASEMSATTNSAFQRVRAPNVDLDPSQGADYQQPPAVQG